MYVRPPSNNKSGMKIPENYSGSAFSRSSPYGEMPPPVRTQVPRYDLPPVDTEPSEEIREESPPIFRREDTHNEIIAEEVEEKKSATAPVATASIFSSLLPKGNLASHFPFGHGIGSEELLILAVMLLVFLSGNESGEVDSEFLLLLGLLLFAG